MNYVYNLAYLQGIVYVQYNYLVLLNYSVQEMKGLVVDNL